MSAIPPGWYFYFASFPVVALRLPPANGFEASGFIFSASRFGDSAAWSSGWVG